MYVQAAGQRLPAVVAHIAADIVRQRPAGSTLFASRYDMSLSPIQTCQSQFAGATASAVPWWQQITGLQITTNGSSIISDQRYYANVYPTKPAPATYQGRLSGKLAQRRCRSDRAGVRPRLLAVHR